MQQVEWEVPYGELSVTIGMPTGPMVPVQTAISLAATTQICAKRGIPLDLLIVGGSSIVTHARNGVLHGFLEGTASRLFWIDSDMVWTADDFLKLLIFSTRMDVVGTTYPMKKEPLTCVVQNPTPGEYDMNELGCLKVDGMGLGFSVMTREVVEKVAASKQVYLDQGKNLRMSDVFRTDAINGIFRGEDVAFFADIRELGYDVWLDPTIKLGHVGNKVYSIDPVKALNLGHVYNPLV